MTEIIPLDSLIILKAVCPSLTNIVLSRFYKQALQYLNKEKNKIQPISFTQLPYNNMNNSPPYILSFFQKISA